MRLVLDTNIMLKALIRNSKVRAVLLGPAHQFLIPEYGIEETRRHVALVAKKSGLSEGEVNVVFDALLSNMELIPSRKTLGKWEEAERVMAGIDREDVPFLAAALSTTCDGIWSDDAHFRRQKRVKVWSTKDVLGSSLLHKRD